MSRNSPKIVVAFLCRWAGRILGAGLLLLLAMTTMGDRIPIPFMGQATWSAHLGTLALLLLMIGLLAGWAWEFAGGIMSLTGFLLGIVPFFCRSDGGESWLYFITALPGALYLVSAGLRRSWVRPGAGRLESEGAVASKGDQ